MIKVQCKNKFSIFQEGEVCFLMEDLFHSSTKNNLVRSIDSDDKELYITDKEVEDNFIPI